MTSALAGCVSAPAAEPVRPSGEVEIRRLADGVWLHTSEYEYPSGTRFASNGLIVREGVQLTLVDTAWGEIVTSRLLDEIAAQILLPVTRGIVTHGHGDRAAGVDVLESEGVAVYAHPLTRRLAIENGSPVPDRTLDGLVGAGSSARLGKLEVFYPGPAHSADNLLVWLTDEKILFGGCAVRAGSASSAGNTASADLASWLRALAAAGERYNSAEVVIPGHGEVGGRELLEHTERLVRAAREAARD